MDAKRGKKGGAKRAIQEQAEQSDDEIKFPEEGSDDDDDVDENGKLILPDPGNFPGKSVIDEDTTKKLEGNEEGNPALDGAIPLAIFDISKKQPFFNPTVAEQFFNLFATFDTVSVQARLVQHVLDNMTELYPNDPATCFCSIRRPLVNVGINTPSYPKALREALARLKSSLSTTTDKTKLADKVKLWIEPILASEELDAGIRTVLEHTIRTLPRP
ncbi:hypothetical protein PC116_g32588 [Phytophthora cactorum]|nr:hypothetical protein PC116_g32588 [Phytophthora cactorum]